MTAHIIATGEPCEIVRRLPAPNRSPRAKPKYVVRLERKGKVTQVSIAADKVRVA